MHPGSSSKATVSHKAFILSREGIARIVFAKKMESMKENSSEIDIDQNSSFFKNSCPGAGSKDTVVEAVASSEKVPSEVQKESWTKSLKLFPAITADVIETKLLDSSFLAKNGNRKDQRCIGIRNLDIVCGRKDA